MPQVLFVCTGNTCRSPVAAAILGKRLQDLGYLNWSVGSVGIKAKEGQGAAQYSIISLAERGIDLSMHRSRAFCLEIIEPSTLLLCMEQSHVNWLHYHYPQQLDKLYLFSEMSHQRFNVPDPYGGSLAAYQSMVDDVTLLIEAGLPRIISLVEDDNGR